MMYTHMHTHFHWQALPTSDLIKHLDILSSSAEHSQHIHHVSAEMPNYQQHIAQNKMELAAVVH